MKNSIFNFVVTQPQVVVDQDQPDTTCTNCVFKDM